MKRLDVEKLENTIFRAKYFQKTTENYLEKQSFENLQEQWDHILKSCLTGGGEILSTRLKEKNHDEAMDASLEKENRAQLGINRNRITER